MLKYHEERIFADRRDAGVELGKMLQRKYKGKNALVLGIPRGGLEVAYHVACMLEGELSIIVSKKLPFPSQPELGFGALTEDGSMYLSALSTRLKGGTIEKIVREQTEEIHRRVKTYRRDVPLPSMRNRIVILVDDGIATGSTLVPALKLCKAQNPARLIVAAPVSGERYVPEIDDLADEVVVLEKPNQFFAVGQVYEDFHGLTDEEVMNLLQDFDKCKTR